MAAANDQEIKKLVSSQIAEGIRGSSMKGFELIHRPLSDMVKHQEQSSKQLEELNKSIIKLYKVFPDALKAQSDNMIKANKQLAEEQAYADNTTADLSSMFADNTNRLITSNNLLRDSLTVGLAKVSNEISGIGKGFSDFLAPIALVATTLGTIVASLAMFSDNKNVSNFGTKVVTKTASRIAGRAIGGASKLFGKIMSGIDKIKGAKVAGEVAGEAAGELAENGAKKAPGILAKVAKTGAKVATKGVGIALKAIPFIGTAIGLKMAFDKWRKGDKVGAALEIAAAAVDFIPGIGPALSIGIDIISLGRDLKNESEGKFQDPPPPLFSPKTKETLKNLPIIGTAIHMKDAFDFWKAGDKSEALKSMGKGLTQLSPPFGALFGIAEAVRSNLPGAMKVDEESPEKPADWTKKLKFLPGIGVIMHMKDALDFWKAGQTAKALKSLQAGFIMVNPFGQLFGIASLLVEKFTGINPMKELGKGVEDTNKAFTGGLMDNIVKLLEGTKGFISKVVGGVAGIGDMFSGATGAAGDALSKLFGMGSTTTGMVKGGTDPTWNPNKRGTFDPNNLVIKKSTLKGAVGQVESGGNYNVGFNSRGYLGKYQLGEDAYKQIKGEKRYGYSWGDYKKNPNLFTPAMQEDAMDLYTDENLRQIKYLGLDKYIGKTMNGVLITEGRLVGASQLGAGNMQKYLKSNGKVDMPGDGLNSIKGFMSKIPEDANMDATLGVIDGGGPVMDMGAPTPSLTPPSQIKTETAPQVAPKKMMTTKVATQSEPDGSAVLTSLDTKTIDALASSMAAAMLQIIKSEPDKYAGFSSNTRS